jgi:eukaryotic-like serine/threonine-protein kinase
MSTCLGEDTVVDLVEGRLDEEARDVVTLHLDACPACRELVMDAARGAGSAPSGPPARAPLRRGATVGRYVVLDPVGAGSMGAVYAAYDPELDRKVALKLLHAGALARGSSGDLAPRLLREAQALARLSHPNVVTVHDVGALGGGIFVAMELCEGGTLAGWLHQEKRSPRQIVEIFRQAGEGLAAAHEAGIVHRDFKPANVMLGKDGRARVGDFGLARAAEAADGAPVVAVDAGKASAATAVTKTGALVGTPAYMAPEQWEGKASDARTDVFSFSVSLHEALYGERPFAADRSAELLVAIAQNEVRPGRPEAKVPAALRRVLLRGLRADPAERHPSMRAMLDALGARPRRLRGALAVVAGVVVLGAVALGRRSPAPAPVCQGAEAAFGDVLSPATGEALHRAFASTGRRDAEFAFGSVERALGDYRSAWIAMHRDACEATRVRGAQSEEMLDLRMVCLASRRREAAALVSVLAEGGEDVVQSAVGAIEGLSPVASCAETPQILARDPPPNDPVKRAELGRLDAEIARARALCWVGGWKAGLAVLDAALPGVTRLGHRPLQAKYHLIRGHCTFAGPELMRAVPSFHEAARLALLSRDDETAADAWIALIHVVGQYAGRFQEAEEWGRYAETAIARLGGDDKRESRRLFYLAANLIRSGGDALEAQHLEERARDLEVKVAGPDSAEVTDIDEELANVLLEEGRVEDALAIHRGTYARREKLYGPDSPTLLYSLHNEGTDLFLLGRPDEALAVLRSVLARWPEEGAHDAYGRCMAAFALRSKGSYAAARALDEEALAIDRRDGASEASRRHARLTSRRRCRGWCP